MGVRDKVVDMAIWEANYGDWRPTGEEMVRFFQNAGLTPPTAADQAKFATQTSNVNVDGKSISWCGIFACHVLKQWGGLDVRWGSSGIVGAVKKVWDYRFMRPGDVAVIKNKAYVSNGKTLYMHHHYIITAIDYAANKCSFVEGNGYNNEIWWRSDRPINQSPSSLNDLKRPYCYYQLIA